MDPCPFIRLTVSNLALKLPVTSKTAPPRSAVHPSSSPPPCYCKIKLKHSPPQTVPVPHLAPESTDPVKWSTTTSSYSAATFHLSKDDIDKLTSKKSIFSTTTTGKHNSNNNKLGLKISIYTGGGGGAASCGGGVVSSSSGGGSGAKGGRLLGKVFVPLCFGGVEMTRPGVYHHTGWICVGKNKDKEFHLVVRSDPDPRFVFQFDGEPELNPQVYQICGGRRSVRQPVFTVNFSFRSSGGGWEHRNQQRSSFSRSALHSDHGSSGKGGGGWLSSFGSDREKSSSGKERRKGWSVTVHDLSGSPVAAASMVTPFVPSPGSDRVSRSNPGCWLILRPGDGTWKPWGRLEAWRERGGGGGSSSDGLGYKFELIPDMSASSGVVLAESTLNAAKGGKFSIDLSGSSPTPTSSSSPGSSGGSPPGYKKSDHGMWPGAYRGFVMSARVEGNGSKSKSKKTNKDKKGGGGTVVEVSVQQVTCTEDAAAYVALAAAVDLSVEACRPFSQRLRKELWHGSGRRSDDQLHSLLSS